MASRETYTPQLTTPKRGQRGDLAWAPLFFGKSPTELHLFSTVCMVETAENPGNHETFYSDSLLIR